MIPFFVEIVQCCTVQSRCLPIAYSRLTTERSNLMTTTRMLPGQTVDTLFGETGVDQRGPAS